MELYPFQQEDIEKIVRQRAGLIGSEMGTGKTHEAIALDQEWFDKGTQRPTLVVAPINTFSSWQEKYSYQAPDVDVITIDRKNRDNFVRDIRRRRGDVFLMHWDALRLMPDLRSIEFNVIIADEVHRASNRKAQATRALKMLHTQHKLAMSGTATGDKPQNLWSINNWLWPTYYKSYWRFVNHYCVQELVQRGQAQYKQITGVQNIPSLMAEMEPWYVRHLKREYCCPHHPEGVMSWLPEKTYDTIYVDLNPTQRRFYEQMRKDMVAWVGEHEDSPLTASVVVAQMARLSQMTLATPEIVGTKWVWRSVEGQKTKVEVPDVRMKLPSTKIEAVLEFADDHPDKQFLVYSSSKQASYLLDEALHKHGITSRVLSGDSTDRDRLEITNSFINKDFQVYVAVIEAAAEGIDGLQHATDTAIFMDRSWSTIKNKQAEDRLHRDGQKDTVQIIDIMARNTVDFGRRTKLETKWQWIKQILGDGAQERILKGEL